MGLGQIPPILQQYTHGPAWWALGRSHPPYKTAFPYEHLLLSSRAVLYISQQNCIFELLVCHHIIPISIWKYYQISKTTGIVLCSVGAITIPGFTCAESDFQITLFPFLEPVEQAPQCSTSFDLALVRYHYISDPPTHPFLSFSRRTRVLRGTRFRSVLG